MRDALLTNFVMCEEDFVGHTWYDYFSVKSQEIPTTEWEIHTFESIEKDMPPLLIVSMKWDYDGKSGV